MSDKDEFRKAVTARKPGMFRGKAKVTNTATIVTTGEMPFNDAVTIFRVFLVSALVKRQRVTVAEAINILKARDEHKELLLGILNHAIKQRKLKFVVTRHRTMRSGSTIDVLKIIDV